MNVPTRAEYNDIIGKLKRRKVEIRKMIELFEAQNEAIKEGFGCNKSLEEFPDPPEVCDFEILNMTPTNQSGGKKERKRPDGIKVSPSQPQTVGDNQPQPDIRILLLLEDLVRANVILNHPNFNTLPEEDRIELQAAYAQSRQELIQAGFTQQQLNDFLQQMQQGGRKSRKKRGKGAMASRMSRKKKHMSARKPKSKYVDEAIKILVNDHTYLIADTPERGRRIRNLALELEDNVKKGGRRKRKSRRKTKKRRRSKRRKSRRKRR